MPGISSFPVLKILTCISLNSGRCENALELEVEVEDGF
jgi:hypothetical protein